MTMQLSPTQQQILNHAAEHTGGKLIWFPDNIKGGAKSKVIESLCKRALITADKTDWFVSEQGYAVLGGVLKILCHSFIIKFYRGDE